MPVPKFPSMGRILRTLELEDIPVKESFNQVIENKPYLTEYINRIDASLEFEDNAKALKSSLPGIFTGNDDVIKEIYKTSDIYTKKRAYTDFLTSEGLNDKQHLTYNRSLLRDKLIGLEFNSNQSYKLYEQGVVARLKEFGVATNEAFNALRTSPAKFRQLYNFDQESVFANLIDGTNTGNKEIDNILSVIRSTDEDLIKSLQEQGNFIGHSNNYFLPFGIPEDAIEVIGRQEARSLLFNHTRMSKKGVERLLDQLEDSKTYFNANNSQSIFAESKIEFKSGADAVSFFKQINPKEDQVSLISSYLMNKQRLIKKTSILSEFGASPLETIGEAVAKARGNVKGFDPKLTRQYKSLVSDFEMRMQVYSGKKFVDNEFLNAFSSVVNQALSLGTLAPARSFVRNLFIDFEGHAQAVGNSLYNNNYKIGGTAQRTFKTLGYLLAQAAPGERKSKEGITKLLDIAGFANSIDGLAHNNLLGFEDVFDANIARQSGGKSDITKRLGMLNNKLASTQSWLNKVSGNHDLIDFTRVRRFVTIQQMFTNVVDHNSYDEWFGSLKTAERAHAQFLAKSYGFDRNMFSFLKQAGKSTIDLDAASKKSLRIDNLPGFFSKQSILETSDDVANKFKGKGQTARQYKEQVASNWQRFVYNSVQKSVPTPNIATSLTASVSSNTPAWLALTLRPFLKFADISHAQFQALSDSIGAATYGTPHQYIGMDKSLLLWGSAGLKYTGYAAAAIWAKDLLNNRKPTNFMDNKEAVRLFAISGFGGAYMQIANNVFGFTGNRGNGVISNTPLTSVVSKLDKLVGQTTGVKPFKLGSGILTANGDKIKKAFLANRERSFGKAMLSIHELNPVSKLWFASGIADYVISQNLLSPRERRDRERNLERYGKEFLF